MAPGDGRIVAYDYGCGAHSDAVIESPDQPSTEHAFDTTGYDELAMETVQALNPVDDEVEEADAVQAEVEAAAEPPSDDDVDMDDDVYAVTAEEIEAEATENY
jgi:hypothetical protein